MAEITVVGNAQREVKCDTACYEFTLRKIGKSISEATRLVDEETEKFLIAAEKNGVQPNAFVMGTITTGNTYYDEDENQCKVSRTITLIASVDPKISNAVLQMITNEGLDVRVEEEHYVKDLGNIHKELLKEAIADSKRNADLIADSAGKAVLGISRIDVSDYSWDMQRCAVPAYGAQPVKSAPRLSDALQIPFVIEKETVKVVWNMES